MEWSFFAFSNGFVSRLQSVLRESPLDETGQGAVQRRCFGNEARTEEEVWPLRAQCLETESGVLMRVNAGTAFNRVGLLAGGGDRAGLNFVVHFGVPSALRVCACSALVGARLYMFGAFLRNR